MRSSWTYLWALFRFMVLHVVKFSVSQKITVKIFGNYGNELYAIFVFVQYFGKLYIVRK